MSRHLFSTAKQERNKMQSANRNKEIANRAADYVSGKMFETRNGMVVTEPVAVVLFNNHPVAGDSEDTIRDWQFTKMLELNEQEGYFTNYCEGGSDWPEEPGRCYTRVLHIWGYDPDNSDEIEGAWNRIWIESLKRNASATGST